jgi:hypothetical protein
MNKTLTRIASVAVTAAMLAIPLSSALAAAPLWNATGNYVISFVYLGSPYAHDMTLTQDAAGTLTGSGGSPVGGSHVYQWHLTSGSVSGNTISFVADYTASADAVTPQTTLHVVGTIGAGGTMSGTWSDNYQGGTRTGTWSTTSGTATAITAATLAAQDFGVVNYSTGATGTLAGYTAGFGLTNASLSDIQSVVVKLYNGTTLLQTNTGSSSIAALPGNQFSSPFDVSGNFNYTLDGYWTNVRAAQYGQSVPATSVVATVTLHNGTVLTATNTNLTGDPTTIFGTTPPPVTTPTDKDLCKDGGWKTFTNPTFKNQGQCVSYTNHH